MIEQLLSNLKYDSPEGPPGVKFRGEQSVTGFINGTSLASAIGLTAGTAIHTNEPWLHFVLDDVELYVAKKPYRSHVSWNHIDAAGAVSGTTVVINGKTYKVRLLKTVATGDVYTGVRNVYDSVETHGSEWNRLFYPIHSGNHINTSNPSPDSGEDIRFGTLAQYTDTVLVVHSSAGNGSASWCQESVSGSTGLRVLRGYYGVSYLVWTSASYAHSINGWRPVLELVE